MQAGKVIFKLLKDSSDVVAICADRIYPEVAHQLDTLPVLVYTIESANPSGTKSGTSSLDVVQFDVMAMSTNYSQCMDLGTAARGALDRIGGMINGIPVQSIDFQSQAIDYDYTTDAHVITQTYQMRVQFAGTVNTYSAIHSAPTYDFINVTMSSDRLDGGAVEYTFSGSTPTALPFDTITYKANTLMELVNPYVLAGGTGYYKLTACVTFKSSTNRQTVNLKFQQDGSDLVNIGKMVIAGADTSATITISEHTEITTSSSQLQCVVYETSGGTGTVTIEAVTYSVERVVQ